MMLKIFWSLLVSTECLSSTLTIKASTTRSWLHKWILKAGTLKLTCWT